MRSFFELTRRERLIEIVRWVCVLPTAVLGDFAASFLVRIVMQLVRAAGSEILGNSSLAYWIGVFLSYGLPQAASVIAGAKMSPRHQVASSIVLAVLGLGLSMMTHVVGQHLAGNRVGFVNYMHFCAQSTGLLSGAGYLAFQIAQQRRRGMSAPVGVTTTSATLVDDQ